MNRPDFKEFLNSQISKGKKVFFDGGMGTMIQKHGGLEYSIPEDLNFYKPEIIKEIYRQYLDAGCNVISMNTFGANPIKLEKTSHTAEEYISRSIEIAKEAIRESESNGNTEYHYIGWDSGQIGKLLEPMGPITFDQAYESYKTSAIAAEKAGADLAIIETISDLYEIKAAILAIKENTNLPIVASMTFQPNLRTLTGADVLTCVTYLEALRVDVLGLNCGGSLEEDKALAEQFLKYSHIPVLVQPNAGLPVVENGHDVFKITPEEFSASQFINATLGAAVLGGCCGTTPEHIAAMIHNIKQNLDADKILKTQNEKTAQPEWNATFICSGNKSQQIGDNAGPVIIGERINPTGKKKCKEALLNSDMNFILEEAESQINSGAHILDVNVGLPGIDEKEMMTTAVKAVQSTFNTPLQLDSSEPAVLEKALRYYNGKALVNSTNGKQEVMDAVFPLIKHYGGSVVALCIDEDGIAPTAEGRVKVAEKIINEAAKYGIPVRDIFIDALTLTVSSEQKTALETIRAIELLKAKYGSQGIRFVLGVSNISFGLPRRDIMNSRFFELALYAGLSACIINPGSQAMMDSYRAYRSLAGYDENCLDYIQTYTGTLDPTTQKAKDEILSQAIQSGKIYIGFNGTESKSPVQTVPAPDTKVSASNSPASNKAATADSGEQKLIDIIEKGFKSQAAEATDSLLKTKEPVEIINNCIVPALDNVGKDFETGKKFLPQLLLSAETVGNSFAQIKQNLAASGKTEESKGTIVLATVYGDIHDIGKNIVRAMLENYGYTVLDLGKNVPVETVVDAVIKNNVKLVGLSALMTTTVANMEETIKALRKATSENGTECKIVVGGAVLTPEYAKQIGADFYSKDAMETVAVAKKVFDN